MQSYDLVLLEGAGGLMVPLTEQLLTIDYVKELGYPTILVTSGRLGSLNHTILSVEALLNHRMELHSVIYNRFPKCDAIIEEDSLNFLHDYLQRVSPNTSIRVMDELV